MPQQDLILVFLPSIRPAKPVESWKLSRKERKLPLPAKQSRAYMRIGERGVLH